MQVHDGFHTRLTEMLKFQSIVRSITQHIYYCRLSNFLSSPLHPRCQVVPDEVSYFLNWNSSTSASLAIANKVKIAGIWYPSLVPLYRSDFSDRFLSKFTSTAHQVFEPRLMKIICLFNLTYLVRLTILASFIMQC